MNSPRLLPHFVFRALATAQSYPPITHPLKFGKNAPNNDLPEDLDPREAAALWGACTAAVNIAKALPNLTDPAERAEMEDAFIHAALDMASKGETMEGPAMVHRAAAFFHLAKVKAGEA